MKIDIEALRKIAKGDPRTKVSVNREWLKAILSELDELGRMRRERRVGDRLDEVVDKLLRTRS